MKHHGETFSLANGVAIPCLGFGTWQMKEGPETVAAIQKALELGYRHIDTAAYYQNERSVGQAVRASGLPREAVFVTSKVWNTDRGYESTLRAFDRTMEKLGLEKSTLKAVLGPCIGPQTYEVSETFRDPFIVQDMKNARFFVPAERPGHLMFNLPAYIQRRLFVAGVPQIGIMGRDTCAEPETFFSYRRSTHRSEPDYGRQVSVIQIRK